MTTTPQPEQDQILLKLAAAREARMAQLRGAVTANEQKPEEPEQAAASSESPRSHVKRLINTRPDLSGADTAEAKFCRCWHSMVKEYKLKANEQVRSLNRAGMRATPPYHCPEQTFGVFLSRMKKGSAAPSLTEFIATSGSAFFAELPIEIPTEDQRAIIAAAQAFIAQKTVRQVPPITGGGNPNAARLATAWYDVLLSNRKLTNDCIAEAWQACAGQGSPTSVGVLHSKLALYGTGVGFFRLLATNPDPFFEILENKTGPLDDDLKKAACVASKNYVFAKPSHDKGR